MKCNGFRGSAPGSAAGEMKPTCLINLNFHLHSRRSSVFGDARFCLNLITFAYISSRSDQIYPNLPNLIRFAQKNFAKGFGCIPATPASVCHCSFQIKKYAPEPQDILMYTCNLTNSTYLRWHCQGVIFC